ncbi:MAG: hypothetical protein PHH00_01835 [Candidatus Nanoarchaeia archaeon]|nr:hypothetical protein [Candidatus Nanoarchaeia archaeon]
MKGTRKFIRRILEEQDNYFISQGMLYAEARSLGYIGTPSQLATEANRMIVEGQIRGRKRGIAQSMWYAQNIECSELEEELSYA